MNRYSFRKNQRLKTNEQFKAVLAHKCCVSSGLVRLYTARNLCAYPRLGISVSKICGNSVRRNRLKRLVREVFRSEQYNIPPEYDYLLIFSRKMSKKAVSSDNLPTDGPTFAGLRELFVELAVRCVSKARRRGPGQMLTQYENQRIDERKK